jgi:hypothetical protein
MIRWVANTQYLHLWNRTMLLEDFAQTKYCSSNEKKNTIFCRVWYAGSYLQVWRQTDENRHDSGPQMFRHTIFDKRGAILWWLFEELLKVFTWLVGFPYQLSIIYLVTLFRPIHDRPTFVHGVVALFERSADELFIVRHTADFLLVFT